MKSIITILIPALFPLALALPWPIADQANIERSPTSTLSGFASSTTFAFSGTALPSGLSVSTYEVKDKKYLNHQFEAKNVFVKDGYLQLLVPGGQEGNKTISSAEVSTTFEVKYASVRTYAILTDVAGVCNGMFFYRTDRQESDIEWISDKTSGANKFANNGTRAIQYTNQALNGNTSDATSLFAHSPKHATSSVHEYRLDWTPGRSVYYTDDILQQQMTTNVPTKAGSWVWNNWVDGDPNWTKGPPKTDALLKIQKIEMYYNPA